MTEKLRPINSCLQDSNYREKGIIDIAYKGQPFEACKEVIIKELKMVDL